VFNAPQGRAQLVPDFHALIDDFDETLLAARQQATLAAVGLPETRQEERKWSRNPHRREIAGELSHRVSWSRADGIEDAVP
jgi:hypothetical protein